MTDPAPPPRRIHLDAIGGAAGDMFVAAMLDAWPDLVEAVLADVRAVLPEGAGRPVLAAVRNGGLAGKGFRLDADPGRGRAAADHHHGTGYTVLSGLLRDANLRADVGHEAQGILRLLAKAESRVHGVTIEDVHFHEIADWDSLMDVVAAGSIVARLRPAEWTVSDLPRGGGLIATQHGPLPAPAPATLALLDGFRWRDDGREGERVTPTGAAILRHVCGSHRRPSGPLGTLTASGTGAGTRTLAGMANVLRVSIYEADAEPSAETVDVLAFDIDDMTGEEIAVAADHLRRVAGVLDLVLLPGFGKKGRPVTRFELLAAQGSLDAIARACFLQTSTLGLRHRTENRRILSREEVMLDGMEAKRATRPDGAVTTKIESDALQDLPTLKARRAAARRGDVDD